jgi:hypothetical protein
VNCCLSRLHLLLVSRLSELLFEQQLSGRDLVLETSCLFHVSTFQSGGPSSEFFVALARSRQLIIE